MLILNVRTNPGVGGSKAIEGRSPSELTTVAELLQAVSDLSDKADASWELGVPPNYGPTVGEIRSKCRGKSPGMPVTLRLSPDGLKVDLTFPGRAFVASA